MNKKPQCLVGARNNIQDAQRHLGSSLSFCYLLLNLKSDLHLFKTRFLQYKLYKRISHKLHLICHSSADGDHGNSLISSQALQIDATRKVNLAD